MRRQLSWIAVSVLVLGTGPVLAAQAASAEREVLLQQWAAPLFWRPDVSAASARAKGSGAEINTVPSFPTEPMPYVAITPCRLIDTRGLSSPTPPYPLPAGYGSDNPLVEGATADYQVTGASQCSIPAGARAVSANIIVLSYTVDGYLTAYPSDTAQPFVATINWRTTVSLSQNAGIVELSATGVVRVYALHFTKMIVDLNGYYAPASSFCLGGDCRTSWNNQDANSVSPVPRTCPAGQIAVSTGPYQWTCVNLCQGPGLVMCGGPNCADTKTDPSNCGACGNTCGTNRVCTASTCVCAPATTNCSGTCANLSTDPSNCGSCGHVCVPGANCTSGVCTCSVGMTACPAGCFDLSTNPNHCGNCANACAVGHACVAGVCQ